MKDLQPDGAISFRTSMAMISLASIAVALRFFSKLNTRQGIAVEDVVMAIALCLFYTDQGIFLTGLLDPATSGTSNIDWDHPESVPPFLEMVYIEGIFFITTITTVKISILLLYRRIFRITRFQTLINASAVICLLWWIIAFFIVVFQCWPVQEFWDVWLQISGQSSCLHPGTLVFGIEISNLFIDILLLCLPLWMTNSLQLSTQRKISVGSMFLLGGFVIITSCARAYYIFDPSTGVPRSVGSSLDWSTAELATAIVCGCLPTYGPLLQMGINFTGRFTKWYSSVVTSNTESSQNSSHERIKWPSLASSTDQATIARHEETNVQAHSTEKPYIETSD